jgi:YVTN family beta-propeller protein
MVPRTIASCLVLSFVLSLFFQASPCWATKLPTELRNGILKAYPGAKIRLDGAFETIHQELFIPLIPAKAHAVTGDEAALQGTFPTKQEPTLLVFANAWSFLRVIQHGKLRIIRPPLDMPETFRKFLLTGKFAPDLIVPDHFVVPESFKPVAGELGIEVVEDVIYNRADFGITSKIPVTANQKHSEHEHGAIMVLAPSTGKITMLEESDLSKVMEFPTEGTPCGMTYANGKLYIADESKHRILKLSPSEKQFEGEIALPPHSSPKGIVALPNGKLLIVSQSATASIAVYELPSERLISSTKVPVGPGKLAVSPNGQVLIALNTPAGKVTLLSALTQKVMQVIPVGTMPNGVEISKDSQKIYVSNRFSNSISIIDVGKRQVIETLHTGNGPIGLVLNEDDTKLFVGNAKDNTISVFDLVMHKKLDDIKIPLDLDFPGGMMMMSDKKHILVSSESTQNIGLLDSTNNKFEKQPDIGHPSDEFLWVPVKD